MLGALLLLMSATARAAVGALLIAPGGDPLPGSVAVLELALWDTSGSPLLDPPLRVHATSGEVLSVTPSDRSGVWDVRWRAPESGNTVELQVHSGVGDPFQIPLKVGKLPKASLSAEPVINGRASGQEPLRISLHGKDLPTPQDLLVVSTEGEVIAIEASELGLDVIWQPADVREARVVPLGFMDRNRGELPPVWVSARLRARVPVAVTTDPGTELIVKVASRIYGPVLADQDGRATTVVDLWPGEQRAEATLSDDLGNVQRTSIVLPGSTEPALLVVANGALTPGATPPPLFLRAVNPRGQAWTGAAPECRGTGLGALVVRETGPGTWRAQLPLGLDEFWQDLRVDCAIPGTSARWTLRIPAGRGVPYKVVLRVYPRELTGDFPVAQIQAHVEDLAGDRLEPTHLTLKAENGDLVRQPASGLRIAADYTAASDVVHHRIEAWWTHPVGSGPPAELEIGQDASGALLVRALDRNRRPLPDVPVAVSLPGELRKGVTDENGWLHLMWQGPDMPVAIEVRSGFLVRRVLYTPWAPLALREPGGPDLVADQIIRVLAGRVREVYIAAEPGLLNTGTGDTAKIQVRLLDRSGQPVRDEVVQIEADRGEIVGLKTLPDGSLEATYVPPQGLATGKVEIRAHGTDGSFAATTSLMLRPRPVRHSLSVVAGALAGPGPRLSPLVALDYETHFPQVERGLYVRLSAAGWLQRTTIPDEDRDGDIELRMETLSLSASVLGRWERQLWTVWVGGGPQIVPYRLEIRYPEVTAVSGFGLHQPGLVAFVGGGYRFRAGEIFGELRGLGVTGYAEDFGYEGQVGGVAVAAGFRLIF
jgi:hypothetical protein